MHIQQELLSKYFTDHQVAAIYDMTVGGMRNKIYRDGADIGELPVDAVNSFPKRLRLWDKGSVLGHLMRIHNGDRALAEQLYAKGEKTPYAGRPVKGAGGRRLLKRNYEARANA